MADEFNAGEAVGGMIGFAVAGAPGELAGRLLGGAVADAYSNKPVPGYHATTVRNDLAPEDVTLTAHEIYRRITTGHGSGSLLAARDTAAELAGSLADRVGQIEAARGASTGAWQGEASQRSLTAAARLFNSLTVAQRQLAVNSRALDAELSAFDHIRANVEPVPESPPQSGFLNSANPFQTDVDKAINDYNAKAAKNVALYEGYSVDTAAARSQVPLSYPMTVPPAESTAPTAGTAAPLAAAPTAPPGAGPAVDTASAAPTTTSTTDGGTPTVPPPAGGASGTPGGTTGQGAAATDPLGRQAAGLTSPNAAAAGGAPVLPVLPGTSVGGASANRRSLPAGASGAQRGLSGAGPGVGPGAGGFGGFGVGGTPGGPGAGGPGVGGSGAGGPGAGGSGAGGSVARGGPAVGTGPIPGQSSTAPPPGRGGLAGATPRGAAGPGGPLGAPTGRSDGDEDAEHHVKYRIEPDGEELFGTDEFTAPPVIGDYRPTR
ncbi:PPE domain-containing protein [Actinophytocola xanthii]|uniref:PPE domain-containing protein n=1 Tax=Actinophytocola xanthii TaxID=1912961 RepID=A0A1Q8CA92_9PSEU|nr:PPE domain-containing protein [Actinophytocola xanthii]OLF11263.1 hypothetical protein BU204_30775 [Actinophytocola xanthii]